MTSPINLKDFKEKKKLALLLKEVEALIALYELFLNTLRKYGKYPGVNEVMSIIAQNRTLLTIQVNKYKKKLEAEDGKLEKT